MMTVMEHTFFLIEFHTEEAKENERSPRFGLTVCRSIEKGHGV